MRIPYGTTGLELDRDLTGAEVLESAIGTLKAEGSEDDIVCKGHGCAHGFSPPG